MWSKNDGFLTVYMAVKATMYIRILQLVLIEKVLNFPEIEISQLYYFCIPPVIGRNNLESLFLPVNIRKEPGFMLSIKTSPIRMGKKMRS